MTARFLPRPSVALLAMCLWPLVAGAQAARPVAIPDFRLTVPAGPWVVEQDAANAHVTLLATTTSRLGPRSEVRIDVRVVHPDPTRGLAPMAAAKAALATELAALERRAAGAKLVTTPRDTTIGCRALVGAHYHLDPVARRTMGTESGTVFAWAPPEYAQTGRVVLFRLTAIERGATGLFPDREAAFLGVVQSLELQSTGAAVIC